MSHTQHLPMYRDISVYGYSSKGSLILFRF